MSTNDHFRAELIPHNSLSPNGFTVVMAIVVAVSFIGGVVFFVIGAWPVVGFFGADVALIYWAFKRNFRDAERREIIEVRDHDVLVTRTAPDEKATTLQFQRRWVRVELEEDIERELIGPLRLFERGRGHEIASFLGPYDRKEFSQVLKAAISIPKI